MSDMGGCGLSDMYFISSEGVGGRVARPVEIDGSRGWHLVHVFNWKAKDWGHFEVVEIEKLADAVLYGTEEDWTAAGRMLGLAPKEQEA